MQTKIHSWLELNINNDQYCSKYIIDNNEIISCRRIHTKYMTWGSLSDKAIFKKIYLTWTSNQVKRKNGHKYIQRKQNVAHGVYRNMYEFQNRVFGPLTENYKVFDPELIMATSNMFAQQCLDEHKWLGECLICLSQKESDLRICNWKGSGIKLPNNSFHKIDWKERLENGYNDNEKLCDGECKHRIKQLIGSSMIFCDKLYGRIVDIKYMVKEAQHGECVCYVATSHSWGGGWCKCACIVENSNAVHCCSNNYGISTMEESLFYIYSLPSRFVWMDWFCIEQQKSIQQQISIANQCMLYVNARLTYILVNEYQQGIYANMEYYISFNQYNDKFKYKLIEVPWVKSRWTLQEAWISNQLWVFRFNSKYDYNLKDSIKHIIREASYGSVDDMRQKYLDFIHKVGLSALAMENQAIALVNASLVRRTTFKSDVVLSISGALGIPYADAVKMNDISDVQRWMIKIGRMDFMMFGINDTTKRESRGCYRIPHNAQIKPAGLFPIIDLCYMVKGESKFGYNILARVRRVESVAIGVGPVQLCVDGIETHLGKFIEIDENEMNKYRLWDKVAVRLFKTDEEIISGSVAAICSYKRNQFTIVGWIAGDLDFPGDRENDEDLEVDDWEDVIIV
jgi:hypothetical protein